MTENVTQKLIVILGATASGKTEISLELAKKIPNSYIISADSRQIYKGLDIGTGKLTGGRHKIIKGQNVLHFHNIPHYMIDIVEPNEKYTVAQYQKEVNKIIKANRGKIPFLVGGTGLYISAIVDGLSIPPSAPDYKLRRKLEKETEKNLFEKLKKLDPVCAAKIDPNNKRRLIRALEVCLTTGKPFSSLQKKKKPNYDVLQIGVSVPREELYERIDKRVDEMIKQGLIEETCKLLQESGRGLIYQTRMQGVMNHAPTCDDIWNFHAMSSLGYKQIGVYLRGEANLEEAVELIKRETRHYARRQMTWFKRDSRIHWIKNKKEAERLVRKFLEK